MRWSQHTSPSCPFTAAALAAWLLGSLVVLFSMTACSGGKDGCEVTRHCLNGDYCQEGKCVDVDSAGRCWVTIDGPDGCTWDEVCTRVESSATDTPEYRCEGLSCQLGTGISNRGDWDEKDSGTCLSGRCRSTSDCSTGEQCLIEEGAPFGMCSDGRVNAPCLLNADCELGRCEAFDDERHTYGFCDGRCASLGGTCHANTDCYPSYGNRISDGVCPNPQQTCCEN